MTDRKNARSALITCLLTLALLSGAACTWAQGRPGHRGFGYAISYAYAGDENGVRAEASHNGTVYSLGYFDDGQDANYYALEAGYNLTSGVRDYGGVPFVVGGGWYYKDDAFEGSSDTFSLWAGTGSYDHSRRGLFFQARYIFGGVMRGSQAAVGWAF